MPSFTPFFYTKRTGTIHLSMAMQPQQQQSYPQQPHVLPKQDQWQPSTVSVCSSMHQQHRCRQQSQ